MGRLNLALVERSKVFGGALKRKTKRVRLSDSEKAEETKSSGRKTTLYDPQSFFDQVQLTKERDTRKKIQRKSAGTGLDFEEVNIRVSVPSPDRGRREGKAPMIEEEETQASKKTKEQILQEEAGLAEAIRLDALEKALEKEEVAKQVYLDSLLAQRMAEEQELIEEQKKRKAQVQFEAQCILKKIGTLSEQSLKQMQN
ncbi:hypothetical protein Tco_1370266 [Tanacetum coccineum]